MVGSLCMSTDLINASEDNGNRSAQDQVIALKIMMLLKCG